MNENKTKYVIDSTHFSGHCITSMRDGVRCDYYGNTIEELRERENNPNLIAVSDSRVNILLKRYQQSLQLPFAEIAEDKYDWFMNCVPPRRFKGTQFFMGECDYSNLYTFCFELNGKFYEGLRAINTPDAELYRQINEFSKVVSHRAELIKRESYIDNRETYIPYTFKDRFGQVHFIQNLIDRGNKYEYKSDRNRLSRVLRSLKKCNYQYLIFHGRYNNIFDFFEWVKKNNYTIQIHGKLFDFNPNGVIDFHGNICEYSATFRYRIYDREIVQQVINQLRTVKREFSWKREVKQK